MKECTFHFFLHLIFNSLFDSTKRYWKGMEPKPILPCINSNLFITVIVIIANLFCKDEIARNLIFSDLYVMICRNCPSTQIGECAQFDPNPNGLTEQYSSIILSFLRGIEFSSYSVFTYKFMVNACQSVEVIVHPWALGNLFLPCSSKIS